MGRRVAKVEKGKADAKKKERVAEFAGPVLQDERAMPWSVSESHRHA
jgi:hypothetical protein